jgi:Lon protease-like protein
MEELPLFPLNTVLFPGMPLNLHIFEERYKQMIRLCTHADQPFGVVLIKQGDEVGGTATPHLIGCSAKITEVEPVAMGRINITAVGVERFQIFDLKRDRPYLVGMTEPFPLQTPNPPALAQAGQKLRPWIQRYLEILSQVSESELDLQEIPNDPVKLANLASFILQIPLGQKQTLLAYAQAERWIVELRTIYRREVALLKAMLNGPIQNEDMGVFSIN